MERREAEYWRGYGEGVYFRIRQGKGESVHDQYRLLEKATRKNGDSYVDAYARGFRDGCEGEAVCLVLPGEDGG